MLLLSDIIQRELRFYAASMKDNGRSGICLSGGVDSNSVLAAMLDEGMEPVVLSYTPSTHQSTDFKMARAAAERLGLEFVPVLVSMEPSSLEANVRFLTAHGWKTKLEVESLSPMIHIQDAAVEAGVQNLFTGDQADGYFINNNWMARNYDRAQGIPGYLRRPVSEDEDATRIDILRDIYYNEDRSCSGQITAMGSENGLHVIVPYRSPTIREAFRGLHWKDVNLPRFKEPIRQAFAHRFDHDLPTLAKPVNLHRGDSYFAERMGSILMDQPHLQGSWRSVTGLYSAIARGDI